MLLAVMDIDQYGLMMSLVSLLQHTKTKMQIYNFINNMIGESKYYNDVMKKHFNKKLGMTKEENESFKDSAKCWICDNDYVNNDVKVRNHCNII